MPQPDILPLLSLDRADPTPLYYQLEQQLRHLIDHGVLAPGDRIPGDVEMSEGLGVNHRTVRQGLKRLVADGLVRRVQRAGTFVAEQAVQAKDRLGFYYFEEDVPKMVECATHMERYVARQGLELVVCPYARDFWERTDLLEEAREKRLRGLAVVPLNQPACLQQLLRVEVAGVPLVRLGNHYFHGHLGSTVVLGDLPGAFAQSLHYLRALGHRHIGVVCNAYQQDIQGQHRQFCEAEGPYSERWVMRVHYDGSLEMLKTLPLASLVDDYLQQNPELTAICATIMGSVIIQQARKLGRKIPDDLSVVSYSSATLPGIPPLTSFAVKPPLLGEVTAHRLVHCLRHGPSTQEELVRVPYERIEGQTVCAPPVPVPG